MTPQPPLPLAETLKALRHDRESLSWPERVRIAGSLQEQLQREGATPESLAVLDLLAKDSKPEVRHAVALLLPLLPDAAFERLKGRMDGDDNAYVRRCVQKAVRTRAKAQIVANRRRVGFDRISQDLATIEDRHGAPAARAAWRLSERYAELLVASMVHDLRSILTHLRANVAALGTEETMAAQSRILKRTKDDIDFLEQTVHDMERFTQCLDAERLAQPLHDLVQSAREQAEAAVRRDKTIDPASVAVDIQVPKGMTMRVAPHQFVAALVNILKNAFEAFSQRPADKATPAIRITAATSGSWLELVIQDNGMGFAPEEAAALKPFTPGRRNKTKRNSTGYGLPNAMRNIAAHGGTVRIDSEEDRGTRVTIRLPRRQMGLFEAQ